MFVSSFVLFSLSRFRRPVFPWDQNRGNFQPGTNCTPLFCRVILVSPIPPQKREVKSQPFLAVFSITPVLRRDNIHPNLRVLAAGNGEKKKTQGNAANGPQPAHDRHRKKTMTVKRLKPKLNGGPRVKLMLYKLSDTHHKREMEGKKREKKKEWYATRG